MPLFSYFNLWNDSLSFKLYSWNYKEAEIISPARFFSSERPALGISIKDLPTEISNSIIHKRIIPIQKWSYEATNSSPFYSEKVYWNAFEEACKINENFLLKLSGRSKFNSIYSRGKTYRCNGKQVFIN